MRWSRTATSPDSVGAVAGGGDPFFELASLAKHTVAKVGGVAMAMTFAARCAVHTAIVSQVIHDMPLAIQLPIALESVCLLLCNEVALLGDEGQDH